MSSRKSWKKDRPQAKPASLGDLPPIRDRRASEKLMADIANLVSEHEFTSVEELNSFLEQVMVAGGSPGRSKPTLVQQAQELMYEAWDASGSRRVELALKALGISLDCADAYVLLAEETTTNTEEAKRFYELGVGAGERALGTQAFKEDVGHFWGLIETRPYMRARFGLAGCLWILGRHQEAIEHYKDMLRLNPNDNQGVRYILANYLLEESKDEALGELLNQYNEDSAMWLYTRALWLFRCGGASKEAIEFLKLALGANRFVPAYLLRKKRLPRHLPEYISWGDETEAVAYAAEAAEAWRKSDGALQWLASIVN